MASELVSPMMAFLAHEGCPVSGEVYVAGGGRFTRLFIATTPGYVHDGGGADGRGRRRALGDDQRRSRLQRPGRPHGLDRHVPGPPPAGQRPALVAVAVSHPAGRHELVRRAGPPRHPYAGPGHHGVRGGDHHLRRHGRAAPRRWPAASPSAASGGATSWPLLSYNCPEYLEAIFAASYLGAIAMPINWRLAAPEVRYILEHSGARGARVRPDAGRPRRRSDGLGTSAAISPTTSHGCATLAGPAPAGRARAPSCGAERDDRCAARAHRSRRRPPAHVHVGHDRAAQGRDAHQRQPGVEEPRPPRRARLHERRPRAWPAGRCTTWARSTSRPRR